MWCCRRRQHPSRSTGTATSASSFTPGRPRVPALTPYEPLEACRPNRLRYVRRARWRACRSGPSTPTKGCGRSVRPTPPNSRDAPRSSTRSSNASTAIRSCSWSARPGPARAHSYTPGPCPRCVNATRWSCRWSPVSTRSSNSKPHCAASPPRKSATSAPACSSLMVSPASPPTSPPATTRSLS